MSEPVFDVCGQKIMPGESVSCPHCGKQVAFGGDEKEIPWCIGAFGNGPRGILGCVECYQRDKAAGRGHEWER